MPHATALLLVSHGPTRPQPALFSLLSPYFRPDMHLTHRLAGPPWWAVSEACGGRTSTESDERSRMKELVPRFTGVPKAQLAPVDLLCGRSFIRAGILRAARSTFTP